MTSIGSAPAHAPNVANRKHLLSMVLVALGLRLAMVAWMQYYDFSVVDFGPLAPPHFNFGFGAETGAIAYSLATGHGFSSPFGGSTGPTAWLAPLYPALCALVFKIFGCFTLASGFVILLINSVFSALTCIPLCRIGELTVGRKVGYWSGWIWAAGVMFMRWPTTWVWDMSASALLLSILFLQSLQLARQSTWKRWAAFGLVWGIAALTNPALLAFLPAAGLYAAFKLQRSQQAWFQNAVLSALLFSVVISPWLIRNRRVFGSWVFIRSNASFEFSLGNYQGSNGIGWFGKHPTQNKWEYAKYKSLGELQYVAEKKRIALAFVKEHPREFALLCVNRAAGFWTGSMLEYFGTRLEPWQPWFYGLLSALMFAGLLMAALERVDGVGLYFWLMFSYPITYTLVFIHPRYRHAIEPEMLLLSAYLVYAALQFVTKRLGISQDAQAALQPALVDTE